MRDHPHIRLGQRIVQELADVGGELTVWEEGGEGGSIESHASPGRLLRCCARGGSRLPLLSSLLV